jgi:hypothetical protein
MPISYRVRILWRDEEPLELPTRARYRELLAFTWG